MKASQTLVESISNIETVTSLGHLRCVGSNFLMALARKEVSAVDVLAAAKIMDAISNSIAVELKVAKAAHEIRTQGGGLSKAAGIGNLAIGPSDQE